MKLSLRKLTISLCLVGSTAFADHSHHSKPDSHAPIGVMRDHIHQKGEFMLSYRSQYMSMNGARSGGNRVSSGEVLNSYMMAPEKMEMKMHMLGLMHGITDKFTLMAMGSFVKKDMRMSNRAGQIIHRETSGFGDSKIGGMYEFFNNHQDRLQFNLGVSIPTGDIKQNYQAANLAYPMQLGSGSYEALPGISYSSNRRNYSYGAQANASFKINNNNLGYRLGNSYNLTGWMAKNLNRIISVSSRLNYMVTQKITGVDQSLNQAMSPVNNVFSSGGKRLDLLFGANLVMPKHNRLALEFGLPIHQNLNGTQLETDYKFTLGWQGIF